MISKIPIRKKTKTTTATTETLLHNENIISTSVSEAVEKIPTDEKDYRKCSFIIYFAQSQQLQRVDQHTANSINSCLPARIHSV